MVIALVTWSIIACLCLVMGHYIGSHKGYAALGGAVGFFFGLVGIILLVCAPPLSADPGMRLRRDDARYGR